MKSTELRITRFLKLNWTSSPSKALPHGLAGIFAILSGMYLIAHSMTGNLNPYRLSPLTLLIYSISTFFNATAGTQLTHLARHETRSAFRSCAFLQMCLSYYVLRFSPFFTNMPMLISTSETSVQNFIISTFIHMVDTILAIATVLCILSFLKVANENWKKSKAISIAISIGTMGIMLLSTYPIHLAILGQEWWECIQDRYPEQNVGMVGFIYVPATITFSLMIFGATLWLRNIITDIEFGAGSGMIILICLVGTVLCQELHIPDVSTQRIYLPCLEPHDGSWEKGIVKTMDFSRYARTVLTLILGIKFENVH